MGWVISAAGFAVIAAVVRDMFHTLWRPGGEGGLSRGMSRAVWRVSGRFRRNGRACVLGGPVAMVAVVAMWTVLVVLGWALVYGPHLPDAFAYSGSLHPGRRGGPLDAVYLSLVTTATLGFGDIVPRAEWLRLVTPLQAAVGFGLLTAAVSWVLQIYPALSRRRVLALRLTMLERAEVARTISDLDAGTASAVLDGLASAIVHIRVDLTQYPTTYYFRESDRAASLAVTVVQALRLARTVSTSRRSEVRLAATVLTCALDDLARILDEQFLCVGGSTEEVFAAFAADHGHAPAV